MLLLFYLYQHCPLIDDTVLVGLYEEPVRPPNAVEYVKKFIGAPAGDDVAAIKEENARLKDELAKVQKAFEDLNTRVR